MLSQKIERKSERRSIWFYTTNNFTKTHRPDQSGYVRWRYEEAAVDPHASQHLVTKILVAKLSSGNKLVTYWVEMIHQVLECVAALQRLDARRFNCNIWVREALETLRRSGEPTVMIIPRLCAMGTVVLKQEIRGLGDKTRRRLVRLSNGKCRYKCSIKDFINRIDSFEIYYCIISSPTTMEQTESVSPALRNIRVFSRTFRIP